MKVVILAGGFRTRLAENTEIRPKPMENTLKDFKSKWNVEKGIIELLEAYKRNRLTYEDFQGINILG